MYRFFYSEGCTISDDMITITGQDVNHMKNVLRMEPGENVIICDGQGKDYYCIIESLSCDAVKAKITKEARSESELPTKIYLFQGLPKKDKMELIIQKAVELGVYEIIPVMTKRSVVKIEDKKKELKKIERWQAIATAAAKQSNRGVIPKVSEVMSFKQAMELAKTLDYNIMPYENAEGIKRAHEIIQHGSGQSSMGIFIGPEGGFEDAEVVLAQENQVEPITLGKRILRTETAGLAILSILMFEIENQNSGEV
jgi:16S rRNA (uracil1498-N3)-methyltransferase